MHKNDMAKVCIRCAKGKIRFTSVCSQMCVCLCAIWTVFHQSVSVYKLKLKEGGRCSWVHVIVVDWYR